MAEYTVSYHQKTYGEGIHVYRRESLGDTHEDQLIRRFALDEFKHASALLKSLQESEPRARVRAELVNLVHKTVDLDVLNDALAILSGREKLIPYGPLGKPDRPYRTANPDLATVPAAAHAALDERFGGDTIVTDDEEVA